MKIAVLSDTHDNIWNLKKVLQNINGHVEAMIHCGDVIAPFTVNHLTSIKVPTYITLGNNDEDHIGMYKKGNEQFTWFHVGQQYGEISLDNRSLAMTHYPRLGKLLFNTKNYDAVFYGHTHIIENNLVDGKLLLNPGAVCGLNAGEPDTASYAIYDTKTNSAKIIEIK